MKEMSRAELIEKSLNFRVLRDGEMLFVNMRGVTNSCSFMVREERLDSILEERVFAKHDIISSLTVDGKDVELNGYFKHIEVENRMFKGVLDNGEIVEGDFFKLDFQHITPTKEEYRKLIYRSIEEF